MDLNLTSALWTSAAAARQMIARGDGGSILNVSSVRGQLALRAGYSSYVAAKGALNMLTKQHATEWAPHGIRVNAISPTFVRTPQVEDMLADETSTTGSSRASRSGGSPSRTTWSAPLSSSAPTPRPSSPARSSRSTAASRRASSPCARRARAISSSRDEGRDGPGNGAGERRVALVPEAPGKLSAAGIELLVQADAGTGAGFPDSTYEQAGARVVPDAASLYREADLVVKVQKPPRR